MTAVIAVLVAGTSTACGSASHDDTPEAVEVPQHQSDTVGLVIPANLLNADQFTSASAAQREAVADGLVSFAEYEAAMYAARACWFERGLEASEPVLDAQGLYFQYTVGSTSGDPDAVVAVIDECSAIHWDLVDHAWTLANLPSDAERAQRWADAAACLRDAGYELAPDAGRDEVLAAQRDDPVWVACVNGPQR